jgi:2-polyprenyl-6-hydroxyphenyl methylase/3-demethylubiquinone-9 3-methyltransferase
MIREPEMKLAGRRIPGGLVISSAFLLPPLSQMPMQSVDSSVVGMMERWVRNSLFGLYRPLPLSYRIFVRARFWLSDLFSLERYVPESGSILDIGCGHGLFSNLLALKSPTRNVLGVDIDARRIQAARRTVAGRKNIRFETSDASLLPPGQWDAITISDVMYLLSREHQIAVLHAVARALKPGGMLVWKTQVCQPHWKYCVTYAEEWLMTHLGLTRGDCLCFLGEKESNDAMRAAGLSATTIPLHTHRPYPDMLLIGRKNTN